MATPETDHLYEIVLSPDVILRMRKARRSRKLRGLLGWGLLALFLFFGVGGIVRGSVEYAVPGFAAAAVVAVLMVLLPKGPESEPGAPGGTLQTFFGDEMLTVEMPGYSMTASYGAFIAITEFNGVVELAEPVRRERDPHHKPGDDGDGYRKTQDRTYLPIEVCPREEWHRFVAVPA